MAETVLFDIAGGIITNVASSLAAEEVKLFWGAKEELEKLTHTLSTIKTVLVDAEERQAKSKPIRLWLERLSDVLYEVDDLLDVVSTEALRRKIKTQHKRAKRVRIFFSKSNQFAFRLKMAHKIKVIRGKLDAIAADMNSFQFVVHSEEPPITVMGRDSTYSFVREEEVIGRESDKEEVIKRLLDTKIEGNVLILPIIGIGGLAKTTLAKLVLNDKRIQNNFEKKMWTCVSDNFDFKVIVKNILESATETSQKDVEIGILIKKFREEIEKKKYFLVLDDVWNENLDKWLELKSLLMIGASSSRILITTRSMRVADMTQTIDSYLLKGLEESAALDLFMRMAFVNWQEPKISKFMEMGKEILNKCAGVPLAIRTIGRLLNSKHMEIEWMSFKDIEISKIHQTEDTDILLVLKLSYDKLPSHLKHCFAYCALFPKDYKFDVSMLISQWIAHGFVDSLRENQCLEDVGYNYFKDLYWRSFFQEVTTNKWGNLHYCKMHDLMHDLATLVAGTLNMTFDQMEKKINKKVCHLLINGKLKCSSRELIALNERRMIRTFFCLYLEDKINCEAIFSSFKLLRVLNLSDNELESVPDIIGKLEHLRYLDFSDNRAIKRLPNSFTRLLNLQFLNLSRCYELIELPSNFKELVNLRHLNLKYCHRIKYMPCGLGQLNNLQLLTTFKCDSDSPSKHSAKLNELNGLNMLRGKLEILKLRHSKSVALEYKAANIKEKCGLECLKLKFSNNNNVHDNVEDEGPLAGLQPQTNLKQLCLDNYRSSRLPSWILSITGLVKLSLTNCDNCLWLPAVNQLPSLMQLSLDSMRSMQYISDCGDGNKFSSSSLMLDVFFPSLELISLEGCPNLKGWWRDSSLEVVHDSDHYNEKATITSIAGHHRLPSFPKLSKVRIIKCPMLTSLPLYPQLCLLKELYLEKMKALEYLFNDCRSEFSPFSSASAEDFFPSLSEIYFEDCPNLKGWWRDSSLEVDHNNDHYKDKAAVTSIKGHCTLPLFPRLSVVWIKKCPMLTSLPLSPQLCLLKELYLENMYALEYLFNDDRSEFSSSSLAFVDDFFPSLSRIHFEDCMNLKGWWRDSSLEVDHDSDHYNEKAVVTSIVGHHTLSWFPKLSDVHIEVCPLLTSLPLSPHIESLFLVRSSSKLVQQIMMMKMPFGIANSTLVVSSSAPLSKLKKIILRQLSDLETLQEEWLKNLTSLESLRIRYCMKLKSLSQGIQYLTALKDLTIDNCPELEPPSDEGEMCWQGLKSLLSFEVIKLPKWVSLPLALQHVSTLRNLEISHCENLTTILESIHNWKSLEVIEIRGCPRLKKLPEEIQSISSLQRLQIVDCPILLQRYKRQEGADWPKVAHIPELDLRSN